MTNEQCDVLRKSSLETINNDNYDVARETNTSETTILYDSIPNKLSLEGDNCDAANENQTLQSVNELYAIPKKYRSTDTINNDSYDVAKQSRTSETANVLYAIPKKYHSTEMINDDPRQESSHDPTYDKIRFTYSLPSEVDTKTGEDIPATRRKPPTKDDGTKPSDIRNERDSSEMMNIYYDVVRQDTPQEPTYDKIRFTHSLPDEADGDMNGSEDTAPTRKQLMVKPPIKYDVTEEQSTEKDTAC